MDFIIRKDRVLHGKNDKQPNPVSGELNPVIIRLNSLMAQSTDNKKLIIPYFISVGFIAISINSIAKGINNHETWRIITASIGGSFFLGVAALMAVRLIKNNRRSRTGRQGQRSKRNV
jgi:hypothetical protein